jgi:hypothetical protein
MARPERFELPTFWFAGRPVFSRVFQIKKLDGPPSLNFPSGIAKAREVNIRPYGAASTMRQ